ncbi:MAG: hypothetical protein ACQ9MH_06370 [Nitrospinales bacterium]
MNRIYNNIKGLAGHFLVILVLLSFGGMTGYSVLLHDHDLDLENVHEDCGPCQWNQANESEINYLVETSNSSNFQESSSTVDLKTPQITIRDIQSRGPPFLL